jgi:hypothetical protein
MEGYTMTHLWEMETLWFTGNESQHIQTVFRYKSWAEFQECKPYKLWKPYIVSSWSWKTMTREKKHTRQDHENHTMDCYKKLRTIPSAYDKHSGFELDSNGTIELLQILFISPDRFSEIHRVEMKIKPDDEDSVRDWLKSHMPSLWKL